MTPRTLAENIVRDEIANGETAALDFAARVESVLRWMQSDTGIRHE